VRAPLNAGKGIVEGDVAHQQRHFARWVHPQRHSEAALLDRMEVEFRHAVELVAIPDAHAIRRVAAIELVVYAQDHEQIGVTKEPAQQTVECNLPT
jgi:hypothetical protein